MTDDLGAYADAIASRTVRLPAEVALLDMRARYDVATVL